MPERQSAAIPLHGPLRVLTNALWIVLVSALVLVFIGGAISKYREDALGILGITLNIADGQVILAPTLGIESSSVIRAGDILRAINGMPVPPDIGLAELVQRLNTPVAQVTLTVASADGTTRDVTLPRIPRYLTDFNLPPVFFSNYFLFLDLILAGSYLALGILLFARKSDDGLALLVSFGLILLGLRVTPQVVYGFRLLGSASELLIDIFLFIGVALFPLLFALFPNGKFVPRWTRYYALGGIAYAALVVLLPITPGISDSSSYRGIADAVFVAIGILAQFLRYRDSSTPTEKQQTKWVLYGMTIGLAVYYGYTLPLAFVPLLTASRAANTLFQLVAQPIVVIGMVLVPLSFAFSIFRYRLWDIDVLIRRTVTYALLAAALAFIYFVSVILFQQIFASLTGQRSEISTILSTLAIAALFVPLRNRIQNWIDRRFNRSKYDAQRVLQEFGKTVRDETDLEKLTGRLMQVVDETMQPRSLSLWLKKQARK